MKWLDHHGDILDAKIEINPVAWDDPDDDEVTIAEPVVYVTGDAYLESAQARQLSAALLELASQCDAARETDALSPTRAQMDKEIGK